MNSTLIGIDLMRKDNGMRGGIVVNIASVAALHATFTAPVYCGSKHAVLGFTRSLKVPRLECTQLSLPSLLMCFIPE